MVTKKKSPPRKTPSLKEGLHVKGDGTATIVVAAGDEHHVYELRRPTLLEYAQFTDWVEEADDAYAAEVQPSGVLERMKELQEEGAKADAVVREVRQAYEKGEEVDVDLSATLLVQANIISELGEINKSVERRANRTYRPDAPHIKVLIKMVETLNTKKDAPTPDANSWPPSFTQPTTVRSLYEGLRLPLVPGTNGNRAQRRSADQSPTL